MRTDRRIRPGSPFQGVTTKKAVKKGERSRRCARADRKWSILIRRRDGHCLECGTTDRLQAAHVVPRRFYTLRWSPENGVTLCWLCHARFTGSEVAWVLWVEEHLGEGSYVRLHRLASPTWDGDYDRVEAELEAWEAAV